MVTLKKGSDQQLGLGGFRSGNVVSLDGGKRLRLDDKVDFWPGTGVWRILSTQQEAQGVSAMFAFLVDERERAGKPIARPVPFETKRRVLCNYCGQPAGLFAGKDVYPDRPDLSHLNLWVCWSCDAWVGCHETGDGQRPLGSLANEETRAARNAAHAAFDPIWQQGEMTRPAAYAWLARALGMHESECHIGMMDAVTCRRVVAIVETRLC